MDRYDRAARDLLLLAQDGLDDPYDDRALEFQRAIPPEDLELVIAILIGCSLAGFKIIAHKEHVAIPDLIRHHFNGSPDGPTADPRSN